MSVDREQVRRDAERIDQADHSQDTDVLDLARHCLALLAELEQAEKEQDDLQTRIDARIEEDGVYRVYDEMHARALAAERELTLALNDLTTLRTVVADLEARLATVPALVEALTWLASGEAWEVTAQYASDGRYRFNTSSESAYATPWGFARAALAEWERE